MKKILIAGAMALMAFTSCNKDENKTATLSVRLTDAPGDYQEVLIDVQEVQIHISNEDSAGGWISLENVHAGIFNLLDFTNGLDTVLVEQELPVGKISQMRLVLGTNNQVKTDGIYYDLKTPSSQQSGLKFNIHADLVAGITYRMWIDFDASRSIVKKGNGDFSLKPVIRTYTEATSGAITGVITPLDAKPYIMAISAENDTLGTYADTLSGMFLIGGMEAGSYTLECIPMEGFQQQILENVEVTIGATHNVDTITFVEE